MKQIIVLMFFLSCLLLGCKLAKEPSAMPYKSIDESKKNKAFIEELRPQEPFIKIENHNFIITAAWIEHPHNATNWGDVVGYKIYCLVMKLEYSPNFNIDLKDYIYELGNGPSVVWFFLTDGLEKKDYIKLQYRSNIDQAFRGKFFILYKK